MRSISLIIAFCSATTGVQTALSQTLLSAQELSAASTAQRAGLLSYDLQCRVTTTALAGHDPETGRFVTLEPFSSVRNGRWVASGDRLRYEDLDSGYIYARDGIAARILAYDRTENGSTVYRGTITTPTSGVGTLPIWDWDLHILFATHVTYSGRPRGLSEPAPHLAQVIQLVAGVSFEQVGDAPHCQRLVMTFLSTGHPSGELFIDHDKGFSIRAVNEYHSDATGQLRQTLHSVDLIEPAEGVFIARSFVCDRYVRIDLNDPALGIALASTSTYELMGEPVVNQPVSDETFTIEWPPGTQVNDLIGHVSYVAMSERDDPESVLQTHIAGAIKAMPRAEDKTIRPARGVVLLQSELEIPVAKWRNYAFAGAAFLVGIFAVLVLRLAVPRHKS